MLKILLFILITTLLSACGFHTPSKTNTINAHITSHNNNIFASKLKQHIQPSASPAFIIFISDEKTTQQTTSYTASGKKKGYQLSLNIPIKVFANNKKLLRAKTLSATIYLQEIDEKQADRLQISEGYAQLRTKLIKKLLRIIKQLNEN